MRTRFGLICVPRYCGVICTHSPRLAVLVAGRLAAGRRLDELQDAQPRRFRGHVRKADRHAFLS